MSKRAWCFAAGVAAVAVFVGSAVPATAQSAPVRDDGAQATLDQPASGGLWQSLADLWDGFMAAVFASSEDGNEAASSGPPGEENNAEEEGEGGGEGGPASDPVG